MRLLIHAPNVHQGGGRRLLMALLSVPASGRVHAIVDARLRLPPEVPEAAIVSRVSPGFAARLSAEWRLRTWARADDIVLCFGNLPPLFGTPARVVLFLQNRYVVGPHSTRGLPLFTRARIAAERAWLRARIRGTITVVVQTPSMAREVEHELGMSSVILPFVPPYRHESPTADAPRSPSLDFLYVSSGEPHKNHHNLIEAWKLLAAEGLYPSLCFTVSCDSYPGVCAAVADARTTSGVRIENVGTVEPSAADALYERAAAVIHPSRFESLGLPLLEAQGHGLPILAAERDHVRDVLDPVESFDPESPVSIARAVKRFYRRPESRQPMLTPEQFLEALATLNGPQRTAE